MGSVPTMMKGMSRWPNCILHSASLPENTCWVAMFPGDKLRDKVAVRRILAMKLQAQNCVTKAHFQNEGEKPEVRPLRKFT